MARRADKRTPTMKDVAELAGVSQTTVSFILNDVQTVTIPEETRARVHHAAQQLKYRTNAAAKVLRTNQSQFIGFLTDEIATSPYAGKIIKGAQDAALAHDKLLLIVNTGGHGRAEERAITSMLEWQVQGIIYAIGYHRPIEIPPIIREVPTVVANAFASDRSVPSVVPDEAAGGYEATDRLIRAGHRRVAFININTLASELPAVLGRLEGYRRALADHGIAYDDTLVFNDGLGNADDGYRHTVELMRMTHPPTAIFCGTDRVALGAYEALKEFGLRIPGDVAVVGFDNQEHISAFLTPPLSTMALPFYEMGHWAATYLLEQSPAIDGAAPVQAILPCPFVPRASL